MPLLLCRGETWLSELLDSHAAAAGSPAEQAQAAAGSLGLDLRTDDTRRLFASQHFCPWHWHHIPRAQHAELPSARGRNISAHALLTSSTSTA